VTQASEIREGVEKYGHNFVQPGFSVIVFSVTARTEQGLDRETISLIIEEAMTRLWASPNEHAFADLGERKVCIVNHDFTEKDEDIVAHQERESIRLLLRYAQNEIEDQTKLYEYLFDHLDDIEFTDPVYSQLLNEFKTRLGAGQDVGVDYFMSLEDESIRNVVVDLVSEKDEVSTHWKDKYQIHVPHEEELLINAAFTNVLRLKIRVIRKLIEENKVKLKEQTEPDQQEYYLKIHQELKKSEMEIAKPLGNIFY
jgi:hypothetical protein